MATTKILLRDAAVAAANLSTSQHRFVKKDGTGKIALCGAGQLAAGILQDKPIAGKVGSYDVIGISKVIAGATVVDGTVGMSDAAGAAITATATNYGLVQFLENGVAGQLVRVQMQISGAKFS